MKIFRIALLLTPALSIILLDRGETLSALLLLAALGIISVKLKKYGFIEERNSGLSGFASTLAGAILIILSLFTALMTIDKQSVIFLTATIALVACAEAIVFRNRA